VSFPEGKVYFTKAKLKPWGGWEARMVSTCFQVSSHQHHMHSASKDGQRAERTATKGRGVSRSTVCRYCTDYEAHTRLHRKWLSVTPPVKLDFPTDECLPSLDRLSVDNS
jgi:hypothetical protein